MTITPIAFGRVLLRMVLIAVPLLLARAAVAQTAGGPSAKGPSAKATPPLSGWTERWVGMWATDPAPRRTRPEGGNPDFGLDEVVIARLQPWALARSRASDPELEDMGQLCKPTGLLRAGSGGPIEFLASPEKITLIARGGGGIGTGGIRRIYLNRPHPKNSPLTYFGDSVGHWEGDTLVIDTIGLNSKTFLTGGERTRHSEELHVVERIRFIENDRLEHVWTVDDPLALTAPYTFTRYHTKQPPNTPLAENLCQDTPESRRAWVKIYNRALKEFESQRAEQPAAQKTD